MHFLKPPTPEHPQNTPKTIFLLNPSIKKNYDFFYLINLHEKKSPGAPVEGPFKRLELPYSLHVLCSCTRMASQECNTNTIMNHKISCLPWGLLRIQGCL